MSAPEVRTEAGRLTEGHEPGPGNLVDTPRTALDAAWAMLERESLMAGGETHAALFRIHRAAIEAEAIAIERARIDWELKGLPWEHRTDDCVDRSEVRLVIFDGDIP